METSGLSASDIAAIVGNNEMGGGNAFLWIFALLILANGGGFGFGNRGDYGQFASAASQQEILFGQQFQNLDNKMDRLGNGVADATFALNNSIKDGNTMVAGRVVDEGRAIQSQLAECCCSIKEAVHSEGEATRGLIQQNKIDALQSQLNTVQTQQAIQNAMCGVPKVNPYMYNISPSCGCTGLATI